MKALLLSQYRKLEFTELRCACAGQDEVLIRVAACGICGSDVHGYDGSSGRRIPPIVMGHEAAGTVAAVGEASKWLIRGRSRHCRFDRLLRRLSQLLPRGYQLVRSPRSLGVSCGDYRRAGAFAELVVVPARIVHRLPDNLPFAEAAMLEAVAVALHAVSLAPVSSGRYRPRNRRRYHWAFAAASFASRRMLARVCHRCRPNSTETEP